MIGYNKVLGNLLFECFNIKILRDIEGRAIKSKIRIGTIYQIIFIAVSSMIDRIILGLSIESKDSEEFFDPSLQHVTLIGMLKLVVVEGVPRLIQLLIVVGILTIIWINLMM